MRITRCIRDRETKACTTPESPKPKMSGHSVSQNMKNAIRKLSAMRPRKCITVGRTLLRLSEPLDGLDQLLDLGLIHLAHGGRHTALDVVLEEEKPHLVNRGLDGIDLGQNVDAVRFLIDHPRDAADLPFDPPQTGKEGVAILYVAWVHDSLKIYPRRVSPSQAGFRAAMRSTIPHLSRSKCSTWKPSART